MSEVGFVQSFYTCQKHQQHMCVGFLDMRIDIFERSTHNANGCSSSSVAFLRQTLDNPPGTQCQGPWVYDWPGTCNGLGWQRAYECTQIQSTLLVTSPEHVDLHTITQQLHHRT